MRRIAVSMSRSPRLESIALLTALVLVVGTSMTPPAARAQSTKRTAVVGLLGTSATTAETLFGAFRQSLRDGGWVEGEPSVSRCAIRRGDPNDSLNWPVNWSGSRVM